MRYALLFGNDHYDDAAINDLTHALSDMSDLKTFLGSTLPKESRFKVDSAFNPKSEHVEQKLSRMLGGLKEAEKTLPPGERNLALFFFAGHGVTVGTETRLLCSNTTELALTSSAATSGTVNLDLVKTIARELPATDFVVWLDVCRSIVSGRGLGASVTLGALRDVTGWNPAGAGVGGHSARRLVLSSCADGQTASDSGAYMAEAIRLMHESLESKSGVELGSNFSETLASRLRARGLTQTPTANGRPVLLVPADRAGSNPAFVRRVSIGGSGASAAGTGAVSGQASGSVGQTGGFDPVSAGWAYNIPGTRETPQCGYTELCALISSGVVKGNYNVWTAKFGTDPLTCWRRVADLPYFASCLPSSSSVGGWRDSKLRPAGTRRILKIAGRDYGLCWRPSCSFMMGSRETEQGRGSDELLRRVTLTRGAWVFETLVTRRLWRDVVGTTPAAHVGENLPVDNVHYNDCLDFLARLNQRWLPESGLVFRLPTEAEWECAARAGTQSPFWWGARYDKNRANCHNYCGGVTKACRYEPNPWGLYDVHGNLREWTSDFYAPYDPAPAPDPAVTTGVSGAQRVVRGGDWREPPEYARAACRLTAPTLKRSDDIGFRFILCEQRG